MELVSREVLLRFWDSYIAEGGARRRRLSTHVFAPKAAPPQLRVDTLPEEYFPPTADRLGLGKSDRQL